jgi:hypothetical protein
VAHGLSRAFGPQLQSRGNRRDRQSVSTSKVKFLLWCILFVLCWPLALLALIVYPLIWILLIPFRLVGIAVDGALGLVRAIVMLPARVIAGPRYF